MICSQTLLLIEDFAPDREMYRRFLRSDSDRDYRLLEAETIGEALEFCRTEAIDAILLDYSLPDGDGLEFLQALCTQAQEDHPPVIMVTGEGSEQIAVQAIKLGAEDYLVKRHLTPELLQITMRSAIENAQARLQLRQSNERFRVSINNMLDCFAICSAMRDQSGQIIDFRIDYLNAAAMADTQLTPDDVGRGLCEVFPAHYETGMFDAYCRVIETGEPLKRENLIHADEFGGQYLTKAYDIRANKLDDGFVISWRDVTERKQAELRQQHLITQLQESDRRFRSIFNTTFQFVGLLSPDGIVLEANQTVLDFGGLEFEEVVNRPFWEIRWWTISPETQQQLRAAIAQARQGEFVRYEVEVLGNGTTTMTIDFSLKPVRDETGDVVLLIPEGRDITDRKQAEEERQQLLIEAESAREQAELANRSKDDFVAMVAHELRSPLNSIAGWAQLLQTQKLDPAIISKALDTIWRNTQAQVQLVEDLLDISRMIRGKLQIQTAPVNWVEIIEAAIDVVRPMAEAKQIELESQLEPVSQISGDFNRLQQIGVNLLTNAIKFTPTGGRVEIQLRQVDSQAVLSVRDTGKGIAPEFLPQIFEQYQQGQKNIGSKDGLGLGLAIVKHLVELHHGTVAAESEGEGQGATFTVRLPIFGSDRNKQAFSDT